MSSWSNAAAPPSPDRLVCRGITPGFPGYGAGRSARRRPPERHEGPASILRPLVRPGGRSLPVFRERHTTLLALRAVPRPWPSGSARSSASRRNRSEEDPRTTRSAPALSSAATAVASAGDGDVSAHAAVPGVTAPASGTSVVYPDGAGRLMETDAVGASVRPPYAVVPAMRTPHWVAECDPRAGAGEGPRRRWPRPVDPRGSARVGPPRSSSGPERVRRRPRPRSFSGGRSGPAVVHPASRVRRLGLIRPSPKPCSASSLSLRLGCGPAFGRR